jgi:hypothetical protein
MATVGRERGNALPLDHERRPMPREGGMHGAVSKGSKAALAALLIGLACPGIACSVEAATFILADGDVIQGDIIDHAAGNAIIQREIGGAISSALTLIQSVAFRLSDGNRIRGTLIDWNEDVYVVRDERGDRLMQIERMEDRSYLMRSVSATVLTASPPPVESSPSPSPAERDLPPPTEGLPVGRAASHPPTM